EGATEDAKRAQLEGSALLSQVLTLDKIVRFGALLEDRLEIDRVYFAEAAKELPAERTSARGRLPREAFPKSAPPADPVLDPWIVEALQKLPPGGVTGVEMSRSNLYYVVRLQGIRKGREVVYSQVRDEVFEGILREPPAQQEYLRWMEREVVRCRIEYSDGASRRDRSRGSP